MMTAIDDDFTRDPNGGGLVPTHKRIAEMTENFQKTWGHRERAKRAGRDPDAHPLPGFQNPICVDDCELNRRDYDDSSTAEE